MRLVLIGPGAVDGRTSVVWEGVRDVLRTLGPDDEVVHTGGDGVGMMVDSIARRAKGVEKRRLPRIDRQMPEVPKYERLDAYRRNALQLVHVRMPDFVVYVGEGTDAETAPVLELALRETASGRIYPRIAVLSHEDFVRERVQR